MRDENVARGCPIRKRERLNQQFIELESTKAELKQVQELLEKERETFFPILHKAPYGIALMDNDGRFIYINPAFTNITGYTLEDIFAGRDWFHRASPFPEYREEIVSSLKRDVIQKGVEKIFSVVCKNREIKEIEFKPTLLDDGKIVVILSDITERKRAEDALKQSEEKYRTILEEMEEGYFETDLVGNLTFINDAGCRHLGYSRQELIGMNNRVYADEENAKKVFQAFNKAYKTGEPCRVFDYEITRKDGTKAIIEMSASLMRNSEGEPIGFRGISRHVTEQKKMEDALRQSEEKYRNILENMQEVYYEIDLAGNFVFLNKAFYEHLGYREEELIGKKSRQYQDEATARELYQAYNRVYITGEPIRAVKAEWIRKDGAKRTYEMSASLMRNSEGEPIGFRGVSRDITERKRAEEALKGSEQRLADIIDFLPDATLVIDREGKIIAWNHAMEAMLGVKAKDMLGKGNREYAIPFYGERRPILIDLVTQPQEEIEKRYAHMEKRPGGVLMGESYIPNLKGGEFYFFGAAAPLYNQKGNLVGAIECIRDITERKRIEEEREKLICELENALSQIKQLKGLLPICMYCKKIRNDKNYWQAVESYITEYSGAIFSHGVCPECHKKYIEPQLKRLESEKK